LPDKRKTDIDNKTSSILDLLVKAQIIADDNVEIIPKLVINFM
jgi:Holliday junction resolvase RusA-like endonuclease